MPEDKTPDLNLAPRSPLHGLALPGRLGHAKGHAKGDAGVTIREIQNVQISLVLARNGHTAETAHALSTLTGVEVPDRATRASTATGNATSTAITAATGVAPGQWLITRRASSDPVLNDELTAKLAGLARVIDQSHSRLVLDVSGPRARDALAKGVALDLDPAVFKPGSAAQTAASHINLQIALLDAVPTFEIMTASSSAASFWSWLTASCAEYGVDVMKPTA